MKLRRFLLQFTKHYRSRCQTALPALGKVAAGCHLHSAFRASIASSSLSNGSNCSTNLLRIIRFWIFVPMLMSATSPPFFSTDTYAPVKAPSPELPMIVTSAKSTKNLGVPVQLAICSSKDPFEFKCGRTKNLTAQFQNDNNMPFL